MLIWITSNSHQFTTKEETFKIQINVKLSSTSKLTYPNLLIGLEKLLIQLETKVNVDHVGLSPLVVLLKDFMPSQLENSMSSLYNNSLTVLVDPMKMKDAMVDKWMLPSGMLLTTVLLLKAHIPTLEETENANTLKQ